MNKLISGITIVCLSMSANALAADGPVTAQTIAQSADIAQPTAEQSDMAVSKINCITQTGSRLKSRDKNGCNGLPGRSYTKADLELTGATTVAEALQRLDPSVQLGR